MAYEPDEQQQKIFATYGSASGLPGMTSGPAKCNKRHIELSDAVLRVSAVQPFATIPLSGPAPPAVHVTVSNDGDRPLTVTEVKVLGGNTVFKLSSNLAKQTIEGKGHVTITLTARPTSATALQTDFLDVTSDAGNEQRALEASAYDLTTFTAGTAPMKPGVGDAGLRYTIQDPKGAVASATIEILHPDPTKTKVIHTIDSLPHINGINLAGWNGTVTDRTDHLQGFVLQRLAPYTARVTIAGADGRGQLTKTCTVDIDNNVGELLVTLSRHDALPFQGHATFKLTNIATSNASPTYTTCAGTVVPRREEFLIQGLDPGDYDVQIQGLSPLLDKQKATTTEVWRIAPDHRGLTRVKVKSGERATATFTLTRYTKVQFVGFNIRPLGVPRTGTMRISTYVGDRDDRHDMLARILVMKKAMADAEASTNIDGGPEVLKIFMAPEFYFRGTGGGYPIDLVEEILPKLAEEAQQAKYADWLFVYGTAIGYLKHGDTGPDTYELWIRAINNGNVVSIQRDAQLALSDSKRASMPDICGRIPPGRVPPCRWKLKQGTAKECDVLLAIATTGGQYDLQMDSVVGLNTGAVLLVEPVATEVFNIALVQRGGQNPGGKRDRLVYKEYVSQLNFLRPAGTNFFDPVTHFADIHGSVDRVILPTEGSRDQLTTKANVPATGGISENNSMSGLGGGSLFEMAGVNFGLEICLDHKMNRLAVYGQDTATSGDPKPQVHLIPSWGMNIEGGALYTVTNGLVFNVDGQTGDSAAASIDEFRMRCPDVAHATTLGSPLPYCPNPHPTCAWHAHYQASGDCEKCGTPTIPAVRRCNTTQHLELAANCSLCNDALPELWLCTGNHIARGAGMCQVPLCGLPLARVYACASKHIRLGAGLCTSCSQVTAPARICQKQVHVAIATLCPSCKKGTSVDNFNYCGVQHQHVEHTSTVGAQCKICSQALVASSRYMTQPPNAFTPISASSTTVGDPGALHTFTEQTTTTKTTVPGSPPSPKTTMVVPPDTPPLPLPTTPTTPVVSWPAADTLRTVQAWATASTAGTTTVISTKDVVTTVNAGTTTVVTTVVTERKSVITAKQTDLFFAAGTLSIYPAKDIPEAEVV